MVFEAQRDHDIDLARSFFIGDKAIDVECGRNAGVRTILVKTGYGAQEMHAAPNWIAEDFGQPRRSSWRRAETSPEDRRNECP